MRTGFLVLFFPIDADLFSVFILNKQAIKNTVYADEARQRLTPHRLAVFPPLSSDHLPEHRSPPLHD